MVPYESLSEITKAQDRIWADKVIRCLPASDGDEFIECSSIEEANTVDMIRYRFLEKMSSTRDSFIFKLRERIK
jgi:hypothetical protein